MQKPKLPIIELFTSIQGEGLYSGVPSVFVRVTGCNLRCIFKNSICDTPYSSFNPEKPKFTVEDVVKELINHPEVNHLVITGGEPTLYDLKGFLEEVKNSLEKEDDVRYLTLVTTIETNGTSEIPFGILERSDLISTSPKLSTSCLSDEEIEKKTFGDKVLVAGMSIPKAQIENHNKNRINIDVLSSFAESNAFVQYKFVYSGPESEKEILEIRDKIAEKLSENNTYYDGTVDDIKHFINEYIWLMPEGIDSERLSETAKEAVEVCIRNGWHYTDRLHIRIWGNERNK